MEEISHDEVAPSRGRCLARLAGASPFPAWWGEILGSATKPNARLAANQTVATVV